jgi:hypothetical protein
MFNSRNRPLWLWLALLLAICACRFSAAPAATATPLPTEVPPSSTPAPTQAAASTLTPVAVVTTAAPRSTPAAGNPSATVPAPAAFCADPQVPNLITNFKSALQASDGALLSSMVSPDHGLDVRFFRNGNVVNYDQAHARFLFDSTYVADWGPAPASGLEKKGSFHEVVLPELLAVFGANYNLTCDQVQVGGATYKAAWPYAGVNFYSAYFPGTPDHNSLDWRTWLLGVEYVNGRPYLSALVQFFWEP